MKVYGPYLYTSNRKYFKEKVEEIFKLLKVTFFSTMILNRPFKFLSHTLSLKLKMAWRSFSLVWMNFWFPIIYIQINKNRFWFWRHRVIVFLMGLNVSSILLLVDHIAATKSGKNWYINFANGHSTEKMILLVAIKSTTSNA